MPITHPNQLVDEFKKSGEFDRLRRELLAQFQAADGLSAFKSRVEDIARQRLVSDQKLRYMSQDAVHRELMQELERYPVVERAVEDARVLSDPSFGNNIRVSIQKLYHGISPRQTESQEDTEDEPGHRTVDKVPTVQAPERSQPDVYDVQETHLQPPESVAPGGISIKTAPNTVRVASNTPPPLPDAPSTVEDDNAEKKMNATDIILPMDQTQKAPEGTVGSATATSNAAQSQTMNKEMHEETEMKP